MSVPRGLTQEEAEAWAKLAQSVTPLPGRKTQQTTVPGVLKARPVDMSVMSETAKQRGAVGFPSQPQRRPVPKKPVTSTVGLDSHWDRKFKAGVVQPDVTLDLHDHSLDAAYRRLMAGLDQARAMEARIILLITGKSRPVDPADRANRRGAIRAKVLDWIAASHHESAIAAVKKAHQRHGGDGALYLIMKRRR